MAGLSLYFTAPEKILMEMIYPMRTVAPMSLSAPELLRKTFACSNLSTIMAAKSSSACLSLVQVLILQSKTLRLLLKLLVVKSRESRLAERSWLTYMSLRGTWTVMVSLQNVSKNDCNLSLILTLNKLNIKLFLIFSSLYPP
jgi:hypothetical protein